MSTANEQPGELAGTGVSGLCAALARAQGEFPTIPRTRTVEVRMKTGGTYSFEYAPLDSILAIVRPVLCKHGLALSQLINSDEAGDWVTTLLTHAGGGFLSSKARVVTLEKGPQAFGTAITYVRRYGVQAILGIATETDDDGNAAEGNEAHASDRPLRYTPAAQPAYNKQPDHQQTAPTVGEYVPPRKMTPTPPPSNAGVTIPRLEALGMAIARLRVYTDADAQFARRKLVYQWSSKMLGKDVTDWSTLTSDEVSILEAAAGAGEK